MYKAADRSLFTNEAAFHLRQRLRDQRIGDDNNCMLLTECRYEDAQRVEKLVHSTFPVCRIDKIRQVNNRPMYGMYVLRKEEMLLECRRTTREVQEFELYHVTTEKRGLESLKNGLDWRRTKRSKYGRGVSFSDDADYANIYADNSHGEDKRVIIVCIVLVTQTWKVIGNSGYNLKVPPGAADTTVSPNRRVYVKYNDYDFYPLYLVYYQRRPEDLPLSRYFNDKVKAANQKWSKAIKEPLALQDRQRQLKQEEQQRRLQQEEQQRRLQQEEQLRRRQLEELQRRRQQEELRKYHQQQEHWKQEMQRKREEQQLREQQRRLQNDNGCLIL